LTYLLDTNVCIRYLNGQSAAVRSRIESLEPKDIALCSIVKAELLFGAIKSQARARNIDRLTRFFSIFESYPFNDRAAEAYADVRAALESRGTPIGANDLLIASIALARGAVLVTANIREFGRVDGLSCENWEAVAGKGT
jgi:tRNA(fMet)-specific endonuclease VapC